MNSIPASGGAQYVSMGCSLIIEPDVVNRFMKEAHSKSECINCGFCIAAADSTDVTCYHGSVELISMRR